MRRSPLVSFEQGVDKKGPDECWPWKRGRNKKGYGYLRRNNKFILAHREALKRSGVDVPDELDVLHSCDNPPCCNPAHLRVGTGIDNVRDMLVRERNVNHIPLTERREVIRLHEIAGVLEYAGLEPNSAEAPGPRLGPKQYKPRKKRKPTPSRLMEETQAYYALLFPPKK